MKNGRKRVLIIIIVFILVAILGAFSYAFFNYTRTGNPNTVSGGRIAFGSRQTRIINLSNIFPIDPEEPGIMNDNTKVGTFEVEIEGDTDYENGLEYLISATNAHIYTAEGKTIPISIGVTVVGLGTENNNYFTARNSKNANIYKKVSENVIIGDQQLVVGYIKPNTTLGNKEGVNGKIIIKAYIDINSVIISDTYDGSGSDEMGTTEEWVDGKVVVTSSEWNALHNNGMSFQIKVESNSGIWVEEPFYNVMKRNAVMDNINSTYVNNSPPGIDFTKISGSSNGKGLYTMAGTENDVYPIMYYRGDVSNNNVIFGGFCWKIIRTTDTGGIKMIYNGNPVNNQCGNDRILEKNQLDYFNISDFSSLTRNFSESYEYDSVNKVFHLTGNVIESSFSTENVNNLIGKYFCNPFQANGNECSSLLKAEYFNETTGDIGFTQVTQDSSIILDNNDSKKNNTQYNIEVKSLASVGYMYGTNYVLNNIQIADLSAMTKSYFGVDFIYENGLYKLKEAVKWSASNFRTHHYTCGLTDPNGTCESIKYYTNGFMMNSQPYYNYITLSNGKSVEDALEEMFTNTHDSLAKQMIDTWYRNNMIDYTEKIEDTIYCNDRSVEYMGGWNSNGGPMDSQNYGLRFSFAERRKSNMLSLKCSQKKDAFTVNSGKGNGMLTYPVGMITGDEATFAGAVYGLDNRFTSFYLYDGNGYWSMTPTSFSLISYVERVYAGGNTGGTRIDDPGYTTGFRPVISLKQGTWVSSGTGTPNDPYVIL